MKKNPSRQVVEPQTISKPITLQEWLDKTKQHGLEAYQLGYSDGVAAGRAQALREVEDIVNGLDAYCYDCKKKTLKAEDVIAAIKSLGDKS